MVTKVQAWGNSQGLRLAKHILKEVGLMVGDKVEITIDDNRIIVAPTKKKKGKYDIKKLIAQMPPDYRVHEEDWGGPTGREVL